MEFVVYDLPKFDQNRKNQAMKASNLSDEKSRESLLRALKFLIINLNSQILFSYLILSDFLSLMF